MILSIFFKKWGFGVLRGSLCINNSYLGLYHFYNYWKGIIWVSKSQIKSKMGKKVENES